MPDPNRLKTMPHATRYRLAGIIGLCLHACSPPVDADGPLAEVYTASFAVRRAQSCRTGSNLPAECIAQLGDTVGFFITDSRGRPFIIGKELVSNRQGERAFAQIAQQLETKYGPPKRCPESESGATRLFWLGSGFGLVLEQNSSTSNESPRIRWEWAINEQVCFKPSERPRRM